LGEAELGDPLASLLAPSRAPAATSPVVLKRVERKNNVLMTTSTAAAPQRSILRVLAE
jgi:hypothetical protein